MSEMRTAYEETQREIRGVLGLRRLSRLQIYGKYMILLCKIKKV